MNNETMKIEIKLNDDQLMVMREALEFYQRFISGQVDNLPDVLRFDRRIDRDAFRDAARQVKAALFPDLPPNELVGIGARDSQSPTLAKHRQVSYEMYRQIYVHQTEERKQRGDDVSMSVYDSPTMRYSGEPLIEITRISDEKITAGDETAQNARP